MQLVLAAMGYKGKGKEKRRGGGGGKGGGGGGGGGGGPGGPARSPDQPFNFVPSAGPGCYIWQGGGGGVPAWALGSERLNPGDYPRGTAFPDLAVDQDSGTLSVVNATAAERVVHTTPTLPPNPTFQPHAPVAPDPPPASPLAAPTAAAGGRYLPPRRT